MNLISSDNMCCFGSCRANELQNAFDCNGQKFLAIFGNFCVIFVFEQGRQNSIHSFMLMIIEIISSIERQRPIKIGNLHELLLLLFLIWQVGVAFGWLNFLCTMMQFCAILAALLTRDMDINRKYLSRYKQLTLI